MVKQKNLFSAFPPVSTKEWTDRITADLKGADFYKKLVWRTREGFDVMPFYREEDLDKPEFLTNISGYFLKGASSGEPCSTASPAGNSWLIRHDITVGGFQEANEKALAVLMRGVDSLGFILPDPELINEKNIGALLKDIDLRCVEINFLPAGKAREILSLLTGIVNTKGYDRSLIRGAIEADPLGRLIVNGTLCIPVSEGFDYLAGLFKAAASLDNYRVLQVNGSNFVNAGSDSVQELALTLSMGVEYLSQLTERGISAGYAASKMRFCFGTGSSYFMEIAKLRAARLLWSVAGNSFNPSDPGAFKMAVHCVTGEWNKTVYDPYVNLLRTQTELMSAVLGGADSVTAIPFDSAYSAPGEFSGRIAINQQLILKEEAYFDKVSDPASGSYYIENLTMLLAENAWKLFLEIEGEGGFLSAVQSGSIQRRLAESARKRKAALTGRKETLLGTNQYPNPGEKLSKSVIAGIRYATTAEKQETDVEPIKLFRASEEYEKLRTAVDNAQAPPVVFLLTIGNNTMRKARAQFSAGFFGCAGYKVIDNEGFEGAEQGAEAALESAAPVVVICSSDEEYALYAPRVYSILKDKTIVVVAGNPDNLPEVKQSGITDFINVKTDVTEFLGRLNLRLGIK